MEQVNNKLLSLMQLMRAQQAAAGIVAGTGKKDGEGESDFGKVLEREYRQDAPNGKPSGQETQKTGTTGKEEGTSSAKDAAQASEREEPVSEQQMTMAALAMMQNPVIVQPVEVPAEEAAAAPQASSELLEATAPVLESAAPKAEAELTAPVENLNAEAPKPVEKAEQPQAAEKIEAPKEKAEPVTQGKEEVKAEGAETGPESKEKAEVEVKGRTPETMSGGIAEPLFHDVEAAPVKVANAKAPEQAEAGEQVKGQVAQKVTEALQQGESQVQLQLNPEYLGHVTVELTRSAEGALSVVLHAERLQTQGLLEKHMGGLQELLSANGREDVVVEVQRQQESQQSANFDYNGSSGNGKQGQPQQEQQQRQPQHTENFLQQLRLGLVPLEEAAV